MVKKNINIRMNEGVWEDFVQGVEKKHDSKHGRVGYELECALKLWMKLGYEEPPKPRKRGRPKGSTKPPVKKKYMPTINIRDEHMQKQFQLACRHAQIISTTELEELVRRAMSVHTKVTIRSWIQKLEAWGYIKMVSPGLWENNFYTPKTE